MKKTKQIGTISSVILALLFVCHIALAQAVPSTFFGMNSFNPSSDFPSVPIGNFGKEASAEWGYIEPNAPTGSGCPGTVNCEHAYNWSTLDSYVSAANNHGVPFMFTFDQSPPWAVGGLGCSGSPVQCTGVITDTADFDAFVKALVQRYDGNHGQGTIQAYETGNEEDYSGSPTQLAAQANEYANDIRSTNPNALVVGPGKDNPISEFQSGGFFDQWWTAWQSINPNAHLDAVTFHGYDGGIATLIAGPCGASQGGYAACVKSAILRNGLPANTPIWDTEGSWGEGANSSLTMQQKVGFVGSFMLLNWSNGVSRQNWYAWNNSQFGTLCSSGTPCTPNAAATAYQQVYNWMVGNTMSTPCSASGTVWTCGFTNANGSTSLAVWNTTGSSGYRPASQYTQSKDLSGKTTSVSGAITIGIEPLLLETPSSTPDAPSGLIATVK
jgi:hypothetical protein